MEACDGRLRRPSQASRPCYRSNPRRISRVKRGLALRCRRSIAVRMARCALRPGRPKTARRIAPARPRRVQIGQDRLSPFSSASTADQEDIPPPSHPEGPALRRPPPGLAPVLPRSGSGRSAGRGQRKEFPQSAVPAAGGPPGQSPRDCPSQSSPESRAIRRACSRSTRQWVTSASST